MGLVAFVKIWIWLSALASLAGWTLSALGQLNRAGYLVFGGGILLVAFFVREKIAAELGGAAPHWKKIRRRFLRPMPCAFALLTVLIFLGGALYPPTNHTAFTYRIPRVLHWFAHGGWYWIHSPDCRINDRACGIEWMSAPQLLFAGSDRGIFLQNFIPFLLLPGLLFSVCTRLGVRPRVAWNWMWLLPTGYSFLLQAGSAGNDTFPAVYLLAAVDFGCRAWASRRAADLWHAILAAALLTGAKGSNLPLLLPCAMVIFPLFPLLRQRLATSALIVLIATVVSFLPTALLNQIYCQDWSGAKIEAPNMTAKKPAVGLGGNVLQLTLDNLVPPVFPQAGWWNQNAEKILPHHFVTTINNNFDVGYFQIGELPTEDWAGIGFSLSVLLLLAIIAAARVKKISEANKLKPSPLPRIIRLGALLAPWIALLVYCLKSGMVTAARLISPYYVVLLPSLILGAGHAAIVRRFWWRTACAMVFASAFFVLIVTPPRPLWPAKTILSRALAAKPGDRLLTRALNVYSVYGVRSDPLAAVREMLPADLKVVGFLGTPDDIAISFWRPYGARRVEQILLTDTAQFIQEKRLDYAVVSGLHLQQRNVALTNWLAQANAELVATTNLMVKVADGPQPWHIVRFKN